MALHPQASFSAGELDPVLQERTTLQKYKTGLNTARNVIVGRTGNVISRPGRSNFKQTKLENKKVKGYMPPRSGYLLEWGHLYVRIYGIDGTLLFDVAHDFTEDDLVNIQFVTSGVYVYIFCAGKKTKKLNYSTGVFTGDAFVFAVPPAPLVPTAPSTSASGYAVDYMVTFMLNGEESLGLLIPSAGLLLLPQGPAEKNTLDVIVSPAGIPGITESRWYRRPANGGSFGFVGSSSYFYDSLGLKHTQWSDVGGGADYGHQPPALITPLEEDPIELKSATGTVYQQRLMLSENTDKEAIYATRPGFQNNLMREFPLSSDSALKFKSGTAGYAQVLRMLDADGFVAFTTAGIFVNTGPLSPTNLAMDKKGKWIIDGAIPPLAVPGGVFFVDSATNTIRNLVWSTELSSYSAPDVSVYSSHLFLKRKITSWAFQEGALPVLWVTFEDGTFASFTYEFEQEMQAWTRHDSGVFVEEVVETGIAETTFFIVKSGSKRYFEKTVPRYVPASAFVVDPQADKNPSCALLDSMVTYNGRMNGDLVGDDVFTLTPVTPDDWEGNLTLSCGTSGVFTVARGNIPGAIYRVFNDEDGTSIDLEFVIRTDDNTVIVSPAFEYPSSEASGFGLYFTVGGLLGLTHLIGEAPGVIADGFVVCSPNNDVENFPVAVVDDTGKLLLPNHRRAAILHVGRPFVADMETLELDTVEQKPTVVEDINIDKLYVKVNRSTGLYVGNKFAKNDGVVGMQKIDKYDVDYSEENPIIGNRAKPPQTKRVEVILAGDWERNGKIAIRQVDPLHFEVLSVIVDAEISWRSDR